MRLSIILLTVGSLLLMACGKTAPMGPATPIVPGDILDPILTMPQGAERTERIVELLRKTIPRVGTDFDTLSSHTRFDEAAAAARYQNRVVVITGVRVERSWSAKEDNDGITTAQVQSSDGMVGRGLRFGKADEARVLELSKGSTITVSCLLTEKYLNPIGCILLMPLDQRAR